MEDELSSSGWDEADEAEGSGTEDEPPSRGKVEVVVLSESSLKGRAKEETLSPVS